MVAEAVGRSACNFGSLKQEEVQKVAESSLSWLDELVEKLTKCAGTAVPIQRPEFTADASEAVSTKDETNHKASSLHPPPLSPPGPRKAGANSAGQLTLHRCATSSKTEESEGLEGLVSFRRKGGKELIELVVSNAAKKVPFEASASLLRPWRGSKRHRGTPLWQRRRVACPNSLQVTTA